jgi:DNA-binding NtrC family response regulator
VEQAPDELEVALESPLLRGTETILLVEDEEGVRRVLETMLKRHGYQVLSSSSSADALALGARHTGEIHLLITDVIMPGMSGRRMAENMLTQRPGMRVLFVSGYGEPLEAHPNTAFLQKPFKTEDLALKIREVLLEKQ